MATDTTKPVPPELWPVGKWTTNPRVTMATSMGNVVVELLPNAAPATVLNFLAYTNTGFYKGLLFHRVIPGFVAQGGGFSSGQVQKLPFYDPIILESTNGLKNARGTLAMARSDNPNSATSQFFVNLVNNSDLNFQNANNPGYAVFGKIVTGMSVIDKIAKVETTDRGGFSDVPIKNVVLKSVTETTTGVVHDKTRVVLVGGIEIGARWEYTTDRGKTWTTGIKTGKTAYTFKLAEGAYEANDILVRQIDKAGNVSSVGRTGASVVAFAGTAIIGDAGVNALKGTSRNDNMFALAGNDTLTAGNGNDKLDGGSGKDLMIGGNGNDIYIVRDSTDIVREFSGGGTDSVQSMVSSHTLAPFVENGQIMLTGNANLTGNDLDNTLFAGRGNNILNGGAGSDTVSYAAGVGGSTGVTVSLAIESAQVTGGSGTDKLILVENLTGSAFADNLTGNDGDNILSGGAGGDTLSGGGGIDRLIGGSGNDTFNFDALTDLGSTVETSDTVTDFTVGDLLDLSGLDADTTTLEVNDAFDTILVTDFTAAGQLKFENGVLYGNTDGDFGTVEFVINLTGVTSLSASDLVV